MAKKKTNPTTTPPKFERPVDAYFYQMDQGLQRAKAIYAVGVFLTFFSVMGLIWMIPFPQLAFLERMEAHTFLNWGSFFIAIVIYIYLKLAATLSYAMLFTIGGMSYFIVQLEYVERDHGLAAWMVFAVLAFIGCGLLYLHYAKEESSKKSVPFIRVLTIGPIWLWSKVFQKLGWRY
ncbi:hypothetical protein M8998_02535 [Sphingobacterium sp. lm-10]|uniref:hypothetical protein n=1 Tax=Sphingobacterium sp. lm-10 TaxID=2944904 RepID=UPI00201FDAAA|nr:hypothetical protein [Sphingobacterium sp. lm-10]MCL7986811.1 hypothetical protein [Sphingobacterium sp. lm-10]